MVMSAHGDRKEVMRAVAPTRSHRGFQRLTATAPGYYECGCMVF